MREWWADLLINFGGGLAATVIGAAIVAGAVHAGKLYERQPSDRRIWLFGLILYGTAVVFGLILGTIAIVK